MNTNHKNQTIKYALYCRKSTEDNNRQVQSLGSQETELKRHAKNLGLSIVKTIKESKSAKDPNNRPLFTELINMIKRGEIQGIMCWKIDRLSRNPIDSAAIQWLLQQGELKVIQTIERQYLPSDNTILFNLESGMASQYSLDLSKIVKRGIRTKLEDGYWPNRAPIGYLNKNKITIIDKTKSPYIKKIFGLYATGKYSVKAISSILYKDGFRTNTGKKYYQSKVHTMLSNSFYYGVMEKDGKKYQGKYEPIISKKLFDQVQEVLERKSHTKRQVIPFAFRGILKCANCGCQLTATKKKGRLVYYYCTNGKGICDEHKAYLKEEYLSEVLVGVFDSLLFDEDLVELVYKAKAEERKLCSSYLQDSLVGLRSRLKKLEDRKDTLLDVYLDKVVSERVYRSRDKTFSNEMLEIEASIEDLEARKTMGSENTLECIKNIFLSPNNMKKEFLKAKPEKQKDILNSLLWNAEIKNKKIANISYKQPFDRLSKIENKSDFNLMRRVRDSNP